MDDNNNFRSRNQSVILQASGSGVHSVASGSVGTVFKPRKRSVQPPGSYQQAGTFTWFKKHRKSHRNCDLLMMGLQPALHKELHPEQQALDLFFQKVKQKTLLQQFDHAIITKSRAAADQRQRGAAEHTRREHGVAGSNAYNTIGTTEQRSLSLTIPRGGPRGPEANASHQRSFEKLVDTEYSLEDLRGAKAAASGHYDSKINVEATIRKQSNSICESYVEAAPKITYDRPGSDIQQLLQQSSHSTILDYRIVAGTSNLRPQVKVELAAQPKQRKSLQGGDSNYSSPDKYTDGQQSEMRMERKVEKKERLVLPQILSPTQKSFIHSLQASASSLLHPDHEKNTDLKDAKLKIIPELQEKTRHQRRQRYLPSDMNFQMGALAGSPGQGEANIFWPHKRNAPEFIFRTSSSIKSKSVAQTVQHSVTVDHSAVPNSGSQSPNQLQSPSGPFPESPSPGTLASYDEAKSQPSVSSPGRKTESTLILNVKKNKHTAKQAKGKRDQSTESIDPNIEVVRVVGKTWRHVPQIVMTGDFSNLTTRSGQSKQYIQTKVLKHPKKDVFGRSHNLSPTTQRQVGNSRLDWNTGYIQASSRRGSELAQDGADYSPHGSLQTLQEQSQAQIHSSIYPKKVELSAKNQPEQFVMTGPFQNYLSTQMQQQYMHRVREIKDRNRAQLDDSLENLQMPPGKAQATESPSTFSGLMTRHHEQPLEGATINEVEEFPTPSQLSRQPHSVTRDADSTLGADQHSKATSNITVLISKNSQKHVHAAQQNSNQFQIAATKAQQGSPTATGAKVTAGVAKHKLHSKVVSGSPHHSALKSSKHMQSVNMFQNTDISHIGHVGKSKGITSLPSGTFGDGTSGSDDIAHFHINHLEEKLQAEMVQQQLLKVQMRAAMGKLKGQSDSMIQPDEVTTIVLPNGSTVKATMHVKQIIEQATESGQGTEYSVKQFLRLDSHLKDDQDMPYEQVLKPNGERITTALEARGNGCLILLKANQQYVQKAAQLREIALDNLRQQYQESLLSQKREQRQANHLEWAKEMNDVYGSQPRVSEERGVHVIEQTFQSAESVNELQVEQNNALQGKMKEWHEPDSAQQHSGDLNATEMQRKENDLSPMFSVGGDSSQFRALDPKNKTGLPPAPTVSGASSNVKGPIPGEAKYAEADGPNGLYVVGGGSSDHNTSPTCSPQKDPMPEAQLASIHVQHQDASNRTLVIASDVHQILQGSSGPHTQTVNSEAKLLDRTETTDKHHASKDRDLHDQVQQEFDAMLEKALMSDSTLKFIQNIAGDGRDAEGKHPDSMTNASAIHMQDQAAPNQSEIIKQFLLKKHSDDGLQQKKQKQGGTTSPFVKTGVSLLNKSSTLLLKGELLKLKKAAAEQASDKNYSRILKIHGKNLEKQFNQKVKVEIQKQIDRISLDQLISKKRLDQIKEATIEDTAVSAYDSVALSQDKMLKTVPTSTIQSGFGGFDNLELQHRQLDPKLVTGSDVPSAKDERKPQDAPAPVSQTVNTTVTTLNVVPQNSEVAEEESQLEQSQIPDQKDHLPDSFVPPLFHKELSMFSSRRSPISKHLTSSPEFDFTTQLNKQTRFQRQLAGGNSHLSYKMKQIYDKLK